jgi:hypothetical protein
VPVQYGQGRERYKDYSDQLVLEALVIMIVRRLHTTHKLLSVLAQPTGEIRLLRALLSVKGRFPSWRTCERRLAALPASLPAKIACLGRALIALLQTWASCVRAAAMDTTVLRTRGGRWHKNDRKAGNSPTTRLILRHTRPSYTGPSWACTAGLTAGRGLSLLPWRRPCSRWRPSSRPPRPTTTSSPCAYYPMCLLRYAIFWANQHYNDLAVRACCAEQGQTVLAKRCEAYPHTNDAVEVHYVFHELSSCAIENLNEQFEDVFDGYDQVLTKGLVNNHLWAFGSVFVYQPKLWHRYQHGLELLIGLKPFLKAT